MNNKVNNLNIPDISGLASEASVIGLGITIGAIGIEATAAMTTAGIASATAGIALTTAGAATALISTL